MHVPSIVAFRVWVRDTPWSEQRLGVELGAAMTSAFYSFYRDSQ